MTARTKITMMTMNIQPSTAITVQELPAPHDFKPKRAKPSCEPHSIQLDANGKA